MSFSGFHDKSRLSKIRSYLETAGADVVELSTGFFRGFSCKPNCGACCKCVSLEILKDTDRWRRFERLYPERVDKFFETKDKDSGEPVMVYTNDDHKDSFCSFLDKTNGRCTVHEAAPLPCRIAPLKFIDKRVSSNKTFLNASAYGRGWAFTQIDEKTKGAMCEILPFDYQKFENDLSMLKELREYGKRLQIPSKLGHIIEFLESNKSYFEKGVFPKQNITFSQKNIY